MTQIYMIYADLNSFYIDFEGFSDKLWGRLTCMARLVCEKINFITSHHWQSKLCTPFDLDKYVIKQWN